jgi:chromosomal replication initiation ATPase DnaA
MLERITHQKFRQLASLADKARRSYRDTEPALASRFETASAAAVHLAERQERIERLAEIQHQFEQITVAVGVL